MVLYLSVAHSFGVYTNISTYESFKSDYKYVEDVHKIEDVQEKQIAMVQNQKAVQTFEKAVQKNGIDKAAKLKWFLVINGVLIFIPIMLSNLAFFITQKFYLERLPQREKIINEIVSKARAL